MRKLALIFSLLILIVLVSGCVQQKPGMPLPDTTSTVITGKTVISDSGIYILDGDISCTLTAEDACIEIQAPDVTLDCQGHSITRANTDTRNAANIGIFVAGGGMEDMNARNTVRNCRIEKFAIGIFLKTRYSNFLNNTISNNGIGIYYDDYSSYNNFINNTVNDNNNRGVYLFMRSSNNTFTGNIIRNNGIYGIIITCAAYYNTFSNNVIENNGYDSTSDDYGGGIDVLNAYANVFSGNRICNNSKTIRCKFDAAMEGINDMCIPQGDIHFVQADINAQEAGILVDGGGNICESDSVSCDGTSISCNGGCL